MTYEERLEKIAVLQKNFSKTIYRDAVPNSIPATHKHVSTYGCAIRCWYDTFAEDVADFTKKMSEFVLYINSIDVEKYLPDYLFDTKVGMFPHSLLKEMPIHYITYRCSGDYLERCLMCEADVQDAVICAVEHVVTAIELLRVRIEICRLAKEAKKLAAREAELKRNNPFFL